MTRLLVNELLMNEFYCISQWFIIGSLMYPYCNEWASICVIDTSILSDASHKKEYQARGKSVRKSSFGNG